MFKKIFCGLSIASILLTKPCSLFSDQIDCLKKEHQREFAKEYADIYRRFVNNEDSIIAHESSQYGFAAPVLDRWQQYLALLRNEANTLDEVFADIDIDNIFSEEVLFNSEEISNKKMKLEKASALLDGIVERLEKYTSDYLQWVISFTDLTDQMRNDLMEGINKNQPILGKRTFVIQKEYVLELINLLNFLSLRFGTYKVDDKRHMKFSCELEDELYKRTVNKLKKLIEEDRDISIQLEQRLSSLPK